MAGRVLIVDDEPALGAILKELLEFEGFEATVVEDEGAARAELSKGSYVLALLDVYLHDGPHGLDLAHLILEEYPSTGVVLMTGYADRVEVQKACLSGAYSCIAKPFNLGDVSRVVEMTLDTGRAA